MLKVHRPIEHRDRYWRLVQIDTNRGVRDWRDLLTAGLHGIGELCRRAQLRVDETTEHGKLRMEISERIQA
jgi:hypothetical protein